MLSFNKTEFPEKVFLSGADCFHLVLDKHAKKHGAGGNVMRKIFYFNNDLSYDRISIILKCSPIIYWLCNIRLIHGKLFRLPYWKFTDKSHEIFLVEHHEKTENDIPQIILKRDITVNDSRFIEADLVHYPSGSCAFVLSWNHILLDAKGTSLLLEHLNHLAENIRVDYRNFFPAPSKGPGIFAYIRNMYRVKKFVQTSSRPPVSSVASSRSDCKNEDSGNRFISFSVIETKKIEENAFKTGSRFGPTLYFIACCSHIIHTINKQQNNAGDLWLPVPYDGRLKSAIGPMVSNCVSFIFYRIPQSVLTDIYQTISCLSAQMKEQIRDKMPQKYNLFLNMMRHVPLWLYYLLISRTGKGVFASFLYTSTGDHFNEQHSLFGNPVRNIQMIPALTFPPGLTFVFLKHANALKIDIAYSPDIINENDLHLIEIKLREILLADY